MIELQIFGVDTEVYRRVQNMLEDASNNNDSLRLFEDEAEGLLEVIRLSLASWAKVYASGKTIDSYADDKSRFQSLLRTMMRDLNDTQIVYLNPGDVKYILQAQNTLVDRLCIAMYGVDLKGVEAMYQKLGDAFGKGLGGQTDET